MGKMAVRLKKWLAMGNKVSYQAKPRTNQSNYKAKDSELSKARVRRANAKAPNTKPSSGIGVGY
jgi:hypothetical protein